MKGNEERNFERAWCKCNHSMEFQMIDDNLETRPSNPCYFCFLLLIIPISYSRKKWSIWRLHFCCDLWVSISKKSEWLIYLTFMSHSKTTHILLCFFFHAVPFAVANWSKITSFWFPHIYWYNIILPSVHLFLSILNPWCFENQNMKSLLKNFN